jgi:hypothetical protein
MRHAIGDEDRGRLKEVAKLIEMADKEMGHWSRLHRLLTAEQAQLQTGVANDLGDDVREALEDARCGFDTETWEIVVTPKDEEATEEEAGEENDEEA